MRAATPAPVAVTRQLHVEWPAQEELVFHLDWVVQQGVSLPGTEKATPLQSRAVLRGELGMQRVRVQGHDVVRLRFPTLEVAELGFDDGHKRAGLGREDFAGAQVFLDMTRSGHVSRVLMDESVPPLVQQTLLLLVAAVAVEVAETPVAVGATWQSTGQTASGPARVEYRVESLDPLRLARRRTAYERLGTSNTFIESTGAVDMAADGTVAEVRSTDRVRAGGTASSDMSMALTLDAPRRVPAGPVAEPARPLKPHVPTESVIQPSREQELRQRVGDMTLERALLDLRGVDARGRAPVADHNAWLWKVTGVLLSQPDASAALAREFPLSVTGDPARALILDLLASAGDTKAQEAMRKVLSGKQARKHERYGLWLQRLSMVQAPDAATRTWLMSYYRETRRSPLSTRAPAAVALGAVAWRSSGDPAAAAFVTESVKALLEDLDGARDAREKDAFLQAAGNTRDERTYAAILRHRADPDPSVRGTVARKLGHYAARESSYDALHAVVVDTDTQVSTEALLALGSLPMPDAQVKRLADSVLRGGVPDAANNVLLNVVNSLGGNQVAAPILRYVQEHAKDPRVQARAGTLLGRLGQPD